MNKLYIFVLCLCLITGVSYWITASVLSQGIETLPEYRRIWEVQSVDTMKHSRDAAKDSRAPEFVPEWVQMVDVLGATHLAIGTPYDEEFVPYMKLWVDEARDAGMRVWFRGNFASWENWFGYDDFESVDDHHKLLEEFILNNPDLFEDGDILTPAPESENGQLGDPRFTNRDEFIVFLQKSYETCVRAVEQINKDVICGYYSMNGDVVREVLNPEIIASIGGVQVPDHYVDTVEKFARDIDEFYELNQAPIILGEFGAPIPDLQGDLSEEEQREFVRELLHVLYLKNDRVIGVNYWVFMGGSTQLYNNTDSTPRKVISVIQDYFEPGNISGIVKNTAGDRLENVSISLSNGYGPVGVDEFGKFVIPVPANAEVQVTITADGYTTIDDITVALGRGETEELRLLMEPETPSYWYMMRARIYELKKRISQTHDELTDL